MLQSTVPYVYKNAPIPGGGYVTGFLYHEKNPGVLYARTDIGGTYRYLYEEGRWVSLIDHVTGENLSETYPIALAVDYEDSNILYIVCGIYNQPQGTLCISKDLGKTFQYKPVPTMVHGNLSGRGTGLRLIVDPSDRNTLYFASQKGGLLRSRDLGDSWEKLPVPEDYTTFVWVDPAGSTIVVGTAGYTTRISDRERGHSLYISYDRGVSFDKLEMPMNQPSDDAKMNGLVAHRYAFDGKYFYCTLGSTGKTNYIVDLGYSCDTGDLLDGRVVRYAYRQGKLGAYEEITPHDGLHPADKPLPYGFGGISICAAKPGMLAVSSLSRDRSDGDCIYVSYDSGESWKKVLHGLEVGRMDFRTSYMLPEHNGNHNLIHWLSDVKINPGNPDELWFNSGTGVFVTENLTHETAVFHDQCKGIEETVHLNVYGPVKGDVKLLDIVGDLGGFAFRNLDVPCKNSFADENGNRYITCINADLSDDNPNIGIVTARGNWTGRTKGGLITTADGFETIQRIPMPFGQTPVIDEALHEIEKPNVNPGWVAMSPDGMNIIWSVAEGIRLPYNKVIVSHDGGKSFAPVCFTSEHESFFKAYSDRTDNSLFYGFDEKGNVYLSRDGGASFGIIKNGADIWQGTDFGLIDTANKTEVRAVAGESGLFYVAAGVNGLWKMKYDSQKDSISMEKLSKEGDAIYRMGLGIGEKQAAFGKDNLTIYFNGNIDGVYGFYRSLDELQSCQRINTKNQMYGEINSIDGDKTTFGRFFLATGSRGVLYGEEGGTE